MLESSRSESSGLDPLAVPQTVDLWSPPGAEPVTDRPLRSVLFRGGGVPLGVALGLETVGRQFLREPLRLGFQPEPELFRARGGFGSRAGGYLVGVLRNPALAPSATRSSLESAGTGSQSVKGEG